MEASESVPIEDLAGVLVISCCSVPTENLIKLILETEELPKVVKCHELVKAYPWNIQTKYYSAIAHLFVIDSKNLISENFADCVQAVVIHYDATSIESLTEAKSWQTFIDHFSPEVQILTCHNFANIKPDEKSLSKGTVLDWCLKNQYELIELFPEENIEDDDEEDDFKETVGVKRVIQALHAIMWPNMQLKENPTIKASERLEQLLKTKDENLSKELSELNLNAHNESHATNNIPENRVNVESLLDEDKAIFEALESDGVESYEELFGKFQDMKEKAKNLAGEDRKHYAEKVAIAFWKAMGGDEEEIAGLSDSSE